MSNFFHGMAWGIVLVLVTKPFAIAVLEMVKNAWTKTKDPKTHPANAQAPE